MKNPRFVGINRVSDIVDLMIRGLKSPRVQVDMGSFGRSSGDICYGCAATNALCELMQTEFPADKVETLTTRTEFFNFGISREQLQLFEYSIDSLRSGKLPYFIECLQSISSTTGVSISPYSANIILSYPRKGNILLKKRKLPHLLSSTYKENLVHYEKFRDWLIKKGL